MFLILWVESFEYCWWREWHLYCRVFKEFTYCFPQRQHWFAPHLVCQGSFLCTVSWIFAISSLWHRISYRYEEIALFFICISLVVSEVKCCYFFNGLVVHLYVFFGKVYIQACCSFLECCWCYCHCCCWVVWVLFTFWILATCQTQVSHSFTR